MDFLANLEPGGMVILGIFLLMIIAVVISFLKKKKEKWSLWVIVVEILKGTYVLANALEKVRTAAARSITQCIFVLQRFSNLLGSGRFDSCCRCKIGISCRERR